MLSERRKMQKITYSIFLIYKIGLEKDKFIDAESRSMIAWGWGQE